MMQLAGKQSDCEWEVSAQSANFPYCVVAGFQARSRGKPDQQSGSIIRWESI